jgi:hypothetical protein
LPQHPAARLGTALELADLICFTASEAFGYITGASLDINGGDLMMWIYAGPNREVVVFGAGSVSTKVDSSAAPSRSARPLA